jgi:arginase
VTTICVPYHLDEHLSGFELGVEVDRTVVTDLPSDGGPWQRMAVLYDQVAQEVAAAHAVPVVVSGDCTTSLGVLAGLQRAGRDVGIVWFDAHADFHTEATTTSGYLGGMPLALAAGIGTLTLPDALGLQPVPESRIALVDARDTGAAEQDLLGRSSVVRTSVDALDELPTGDLYLHLDVDVVDPQDVPDLLYPVPGGPRLAEVLRAVEQVLATGRVVAVGLAATWEHGSAARGPHDELVAAVVRLVEERG